jgi:ABC-type uncharacterized transport system, ATPase component
VSTAPAITVRNLCKRYSYAKRGRGLAGVFSSQDVVIDAVAGVSFDIARGERVAVIGPNGAGKSTTLKMLSGILQPSGGEARVLGLIPWRERKALAYRIGVVFGQRSQLWGELPARDSFALLRRIYDQEDDVFGRRLGELSERFALGELMDQPVHRMSLGQRMRCEIAASLLHGPELLFLDEPTIGLDVTAKAAIRDFVREHARDHGLTVVLTSHDTRDIELVCERVIVVGQGRIVVDQPTSQLRRRFLGRKVITLQSTDAVVSLDLPGVIRRPSAQHTTVLEVDTGVTPVEQVIATAFARGGIEDVTIEDPPMEEVIHDIYSNPHGA